MLACLQLPRMFVANLFRPRRQLEVENLFSLLTNLMEPKRLGLLRELAPGASLFGVLLNPSFPPAALQLQQIEEAARSIRQRITVVRASTDEELDTAFPALVEQAVAAR